VSDSIQRTDRSWSRRFHGKADFLLTGDGRHFGHLYGKRIEGVMVLRPAQYFERRARR
jgi:hypothetical protein